MPELPEVETVKRGLAPYMEGQRISALQVNSEGLRWPFRSDLRQIVQGQTALKLTRRAKYILVQLSNDHVIVIHLGMSGSFRIYDSKDQYEPRKHDHIVFEMAQDNEKNNAVLAFNDPRRFGMVWAIAANEIERHKIFIPIGPEPFSAEFTPQYLYDALKRKNSPIKAALLDQALVAGLGNIYVCEALYRAGISPKRKARNIGKEKAAVLHEAIIDVLNEAIEAGGSSLRDHKKTDGSMGYFQHRFAVYGREGQPCPDCDCDIALTAGIKRIVQSGRSSFYCPRKQK